MHQLMLDSTSATAAHTGERLSWRELGMFEKSETRLTFERAGESDVTLFGSTIPHGYPLHLGVYSVHTSAETLPAGRRDIRELIQRLDATIGRVTASGSTAVFRRDALL